MKLAVTTSVSDQKGLAWTVPEAVSFDEKLPAFTMTLVKGKTQVADVKAEEKK
jgi:hypothetical protein